MALLYPCGDSLPLAGPRASSRPRCSAAAAAGQGRAPCSAAAGDPAATAPSLSGTTAQPLHARMTNRPDLLVYRTPL